MRVYDTFTGGLVELPPPPGPIGIYWCGPTVYQRIHVGNALAVTVLPLWLKRWLDHKGYETNVVVHITDINDKIYDAAPGASAQLASDATRWYFEDTNRLGLGRPDVEPTAAHTVPDQIAMIEQLLDGDFAYEVGGDVYYRVVHFPDYGRLSRQRLDQVEDEEPNPLKQDPRDFALWKAHKPGEDTWWESPWGRGRPGWHIECSAMAEKYLGTSFEIHGGGLDLKFPHHENEIAQSRALGHPFAHIWMHNGMLSMRGSEMHKSLGNDVSLKEALDRWGRETLLFFFMTGHWRKPLDYS
jgi:cysteinyl-tRNA synthetase